MLAFHYRPNHGDQPYAPPTWADGTDDEIAEAVAKADAGEIDLSDYWSVGDERTVHLGYIPADTNGAFTTAMAAQNVVMVLMNEGYMNQSNIHFVVGQKNCLNQFGRMDAYNDTYSRSWGSTLMKTSLNKTTSGGYYYSLPDGLKSIFKEFSVTTAANYYSSTALENTICKFALFSLKEVSLDIYNSEAETNANNIIKYYETSSNKIKKRSSTAVDWWLRSLSYKENGRFRYVNSNGGSSYQDATSTNAIAPFGCI